MSAVLLPSPPEIPAGNIEEIVAAANALERAAARRYRKLAHAMWSVGQEDVARVFDDLAAEEEQHVESVEKLANSLLGGLPTDDIVRWVLPQTFGADEAGSPALLTPYKALSVAVRSEERAFAFWSYVAANAGAQPVRDLAEKMAHQELLHAARFRIARRKAYHAEFRSRRRWVETADQPLSLQDLHAEAAAQQSEVIAFLSAAAERLDRLEDHESAALVHEIVNAMISPQETTMPGSRKHVQSPDDDRLERLGAAAVLFEVEGVLERRVERCVSLLDRSPGADVSTALERLADEAMRLASRVHTRLAAIDPSISAFAAEASTHASD
jgi:rubrerythrin